MVSSNLVATMFDNKRQTILYAAIFFIVLGVGRFILCFQQGVLPDLFVAFSILLGLILTDIYKLNPAPSHTLKTLAIQYIFLRAILVCGYILKRRVDSKFTKCEEQQGKILKEILSHNKDTLFVKDHSLQKVQSVKMYRDSMSLTSYSDYRKYAEMIKEDGTENILCPGKPYFLALTSGTTSGQSKVFPKSTKGRNKSIPWIVVMQYIMLYATGSNSLKKWLYFKMAAQVTTSKSGIESGPISAVTYKASYPFSAIPDIFVHTEYEVMYIHLAFSIAEDDISCLSTMVTTTALTLLTILEKDWKQLCDDVENGSLSHHLNISEEERYRINTLMKPNAKRAEFLRNEFAKGFKGIVPRIWPGCPCLLGIKTGVFETPGRILKEKYLGELPIITIFHIGTETFYGTNVEPMNDPDDVKYVALTTLNFFEFLPIEEYDEESPSTLLAHQVKIGQMYEMVITTFDGLYRYRTEDVVKIVGFQGTTPVYKFMHRAGDILSANLEKVPEFFLHEAVYAAASTWEKKIVEFTSCESVHVQQATASDAGSKHYVVFLEMEESCNLDESEKKLIDEELCQRHTRYAVVRENNKVQPAQIIQLESGSFYKVKEMMLASNPDAFCMQFKLPRIMRRSDILKAMLDMEL